MFKEKPSILNYYPIANQVSKSHFTAKIACLSHHYPELSLFRQKINHQKTSVQPYSFNKRKINFYRTIFILFSLLFSFLGFLVFFKTGGLSSSSALNLGYQLIKPFMIFICCLLATIALVICFSMRSEKETALYYVRKAHYSLKKIYERKKNELGINHFLHHIGRRYRQKMAFKQFYGEARDKISDFKEEAMHLIDKIAYSSLEKKEKEILYNQSIAELNDKLFKIIQEYKHASLQIFNLENF